jgi:glycosyltransferase involved in cell wall biosynthesis
VPRHDYYFTTGETVGTPGALVPDCGVPWLHTRPVVCLERWPYVYAPHAEAFTTVSSWDGPDWIMDGEGLCENTKRLAFLQFAALPQLTPQVLELALFLSTAQDMEDRQLMESYGWRIRHSRDVAGTPEMYQAYIQGSRGEFSCAKPYYMKFQNAWISDRTLCYLASGKPVVVQDTGPSAYLPSGEGLFRFSTLGGAVEALASINAEYERHCRAAREIAEAYFDAGQVVERLLNCALK